MAVETEEAARRSAGLPFAALGAVGIVAGGLVAAVTSVAPSEHGVWAAAYLVLVAGVAQAALGVSQALLAPRPPAPRLVAMQVITWNVGDAAVLTGTLAGVVPVVDAGGALLVLALALLLWGVRAARPARSWLRWAFRALVVALLVSVPIGLALARIRPGG